MRAVALPLNESSNHPDDCVAKRRKRTSSTLGFSDEQNSAAQPEIHHDNRCDSPWVRRVVPASLVHPLPLIFQLRKRIDDRLQVQRKRASQDRNVDAVDGHRGCSLWAHPPANARSRTKPFFHQGSDPAQLSLAAMKAVRLLVEKMFSVNHPIASGKLNKITAALSSWFPKC